MNSTPAQGGARNPPRVIARADHPISRAQISPNALRVLYRLREGGFQAFLVGGCVRDLLIGIEPKDFDVATDALPEQVKRLFRNCRLVGRRFRLAHVLFGREVIEVATFRAAGAPSQGEEPVAEADGEADTDAVPGLPGVDTEADAAVAPDEETDLGQADDEDDEDEGDADDDDDDEDVEEGGERDASSAAPGAHSSGDAEPVIAAAVPARADSPSVSETLPPESRPGQGRGNEDDPDVDRHVDEAGRILRDNVYGTIDEDVWRRDFTANSLYYNIADFSVWDYVGGFEDIAARRLRLIGDPETRFREDPVRMLRAARFEAKLGFDIDPDTAAPIGRLAELLGAVPPARLFEETLKLFLTGHGERSLEVLRRRGLLRALLPTVDAYLESHPGSTVEQLLLGGLRNTDARVREGKPVTPTFLFALLAYGPAAAHIEASPPERWHELATILDACDRALREAQVRIRIPKRFTLGVREMFALQPRLEYPRGRRALRALEHPRFRAAYDLLLLRAELGLASREMAQWWTRVQAASGEARSEMADALTGQAARADAPRHGGRRRRRRRRPSAPS